MSASGVIRVITEPLGGSPLSLAIQRRELRDELTFSSPTTLEEWRTHAAAVKQDTASGWYEALREAFGTNVNVTASARLRGAASDGGLVVTTGQQAALFGGPLYTLAKALSALALADRLQRELGIPVAPVFWAATDDADFLEAQTTYAADADGLHELKLERTPPPGTPMAEALLGDVPVLLETLRRACGSAAHGEYFELVSEAFESEQTLGRAYVRMLRGLLGPLGISVLDSSHPAYRGVARPMLLDALLRAPEIADAVAARTAALREAGFEAQVDDERGLSLVAAIENGIKRRIPIDETSATGNAVAPNVALAPNVLLRPVIERAILPTAAYVAGPAELAYFAQCRAVAEALSRPAPVAVPRWSCTVIEPFVDKALRRLRVEYHELRERATVERRLAAQAMPAGVAAAWSRLQEQVRSAVRELADAVRDASLMPATVVQGLEHSLFHKLRRGERRMIAAVKRREERTQRDIEVACASLFPFGQRQERVLNFIPMLTRGGPELVAEMQRHAATHVESLVAAERQQPAAAH